MSEDTGGGCNPAIPIIVSEFGECLNGYTRPPDTSKEIEKRKARFHLYDRDKLKISDYFFKYFKDSERKIHSFGTYALAELPYNRNQKYYAISLVRDQKRIFISNIIAFRPHQNLHILLKDNDDFKKNDIPKIVYDRFKKEVSKIYKEESMEKPLNAF